MPNQKQPSEPELPDKTRREEDGSDVERQEPPRRKEEDSDIEEVPARRDGDSGDIERDGGPPPGREGHEREMQERRPHRDDMP